MEKELHITSNYKLHAATTEQLATFLARKFHHSGSIGVFIDKLGNIKRKYHSVLTRMLRETKNTHLLALSGIRSREGHNIVPVILRETIAEMIVGNTVTPTMEANYIALGSGNTTPANSDTTLATETIRQTFTEKFAVSNVAYLDKFFSSSDVGGNSYLEAGIFVDGTASADSGFLLSRILISETLTATENLTVNASITIA